MRAKQLTQALSLAETEDFLERLIDSSGVGFGVEDTSGLLEELHIKHKIRTFPVYSVASRSEAGTEMVRGEGNKGARPEVRTPVAGGLLIACELSGGVDT